MSLTGLGWLFTLGVLLHNAEEAMLLPSWSPPGRRLLPQVPPRAFKFATVVLGAFFGIVAAFASLQPPGSLSAYLMASLALAMIVNALVPHLVGSLLARSLMPGTATGILLNLPLGALYLRRALTTGSVHPGTFVWVGPLAGLGLLASMPVLFWVCGPHRWPGTKRRGGSS